MSLIPNEELRKQGSINFAPLVDFLFLALAVFATLAISRAALHDSEIKLVKVNPSASPLLGSQDLYLVTLSITEKGQYKWISEVSEYLMDGPMAIEQELKRQQDSGLLPKEKEKIKVLLHIDRHAFWEPIAKLVLALKEQGFSVHPVYERGTEEGANGRKMDKE